LHKKCILDETAQRGLSLIDLRTQRRLSRQRGVLLDLPTTVSKEKADGDTGKNDSESYGHGYDGIELHQS